jgi:hypothetical protein
VIVGLLAVLGLLGWAVAPAPTQPTTEAPRWSTCEASDVDGDVVLRIWYAWSDGSSIGDCTALDVELALVSRVAAWRPGKPEGEPDRVDCRMAKEENGLEVAVEALRPRDGVAACEQLASGHPIALVGPWETNGEATVEWTASDGIGLTLATGRSEALRSSSWVPPDFAVSAYLAPSSDVLEAGVGCFGSRTTYAVLVTQDGRWRVERRTSDSAGDLESGTTDLAAGAPYHLALRCTWASDTTVTIEATMNGQALAVVDDPEAVGGIGGLPGFFTGALVTAVGPAGTTVDAADIRAVLPWTAVEE